MKPITLARIEIIKSIWQPGMSAADIANAIPVDKWGGKPSRGAIVGMFDRWKVELESCRLTVAPNKRPKEKEPVKADPKRRNTKFVDIGYRVPPPKRNLNEKLRQDYSLSEKAIRKHEHEERMLARDRKNVTSPAYRFRGRGDGFG